MPAAVAALIREKTRSLVLADDQALSMRAVARAVGVAATSFCIHFPDRDALVPAALEACHRDLPAAVDKAEETATDPVGRWTAL